MSYSVYATRYISFCRAVGPVSSLALVEGRAAHIALCITQLGVSLKIVPSSLSVENFAARWPLLRRPGARAHSSTFLGSKHEWHTLQRNSPCPWCWAATRVDLPPDRSTVQPCCRSKARTYGRQHSTPVLADPPLKRKHPPADLGKVLDVKVSVFAPIIFFPSPLTSLAPGSGSNSATGKPLKLSAFLSSHTTGKGRLAGSAK